MYEKCVKLDSLSDIPLVEYYMNKTINGVSCGKLFDITSYYYVCDDICLFPKLVNDTYRLFTKDALDIGIDLKLKRQLK